VACGCVTKKRRSGVRKRFEAAGILVAALIAASAPVAHAEETVCRGTITDRTVDNLRVPQEATCTLRRVVAQGTVKIERDATLDAHRLRVIGNVQGENADKVLIRRSRVGGSVQIVQGGGARVENTRVKMDILYDSNRRFLAALNNNVGGNIQAFQNSGGVRIADNFVDGNLQCKENKPPPTGGNNTVQGNKEDQCKNL
jgi:hypothetical protein